MSDNRSGSFVGGLFIGAIAGAVAGLLVAPKTGRETRLLIRKSADALPELVEDLSSSVQLQADRLSETALRNWDGTLGRLKEALAAGVEASQREVQEISAEARSNGEGRSPLPKGSAVRDSGAR
jgi:gas vesicle protein